MPFTITSMLQLVMKFSSMCKGLHHILGLRNILPTRLLLVSPHFLHFLSFHILALPTADHSMGRDCVKGWHICLHIIMTHNYANITSCVLETSSFGAANMAGDGPHDVMPQF